MSRVALVNMPFGTTTRPAIGISLLKAGLARHDIQTDLHYMNLRLAKRLRIDRYEQICNVNDTLLAEYIFAKGLFGDRLPTPEEYSDRILANLLRIGEQANAEERRETLSTWVHVLTEHARMFLDECMSSVPWAQYSIVGFTSTFHQTMASVALATRLKQEFPNLKVMFGGANCEGNMGVTLHRVFPVIDFVCSGEGDLCVPTLVKRLLAEEEPGDIAGIIQRRDGQTVRPTQHGAPVHNMDDLPQPDYQEYVAQREQLLGLTDPPEVLVETARGCWWGHKSHCTFCGLNGESMKYRAKSSARALEDIRALAREYKTKRIASTDNIIAMEYFDHVLPELRKDGLGLDMFYETKANLRRSQIRALREAGVLRIQPGIESLNSATLKLMRKGVSALQNIQLLRWCAEFMVEPHWNLLAGFPGEDPSHYARQAKLAQLLVHLPPPQDCNLLRLDRFSPLYEQAEERGLVNVRPRDAYRYVYPFAQEDVHDLAYFFDFDYADGRQPLGYVTDLQAEVARWKQLHPTANLTTLSFADCLLVWDTRVPNLRKEHWLTDLPRLVYEICDEARTMEGLKARVLQAGASISGLDDAIYQLADAGLILHEDGRWLSLGVSADYQVEALADAVAHGVTPARTSTSFERLMSLAPHLIRGLVLAYANGTPPEVEDSAPPSKIKLHVVHA